LVDGRARLLKLDALRASTIDEYAAVRDAYLAKRASDVRDGAVEDEAEELQMLTPLPVDNE
jgi:phospholipid-binding lipoprotein MlaA